jgi:hypothetical protein
VPAVVLALDAGSQRQQHDKYVSCVRRFVGERHLHRSRAVRPALQPQRVPRRVRWLSRVPSGDLPRRINCRHIPVPVIRWIQTDVCCDGLPAVPAQQAAPVAAAPSTATMRRKERRIREPDPAPRPATVAASTSLAESLRPSNVAVAIELLNGRNVK